MASTAAAGLLGASPATLGLTAVGAVAPAVINALRGTAHLKANQFVQSFQNPFGKELSNIFDPIQKAQAGKTLTYDDANTALTRFNEEWAGFQSAADQFSAKGGDYAKVVKQAYDPTGDFMKTVNMVKTNLTDWTSGLKPADTNSSSSTTAGAPGTTTNITDPNTPPTLNTILSELGMTPPEAARTAAVTQGKKALAAPGFSSTLLGGTFGKPKTQQKTLLGF